MIKDKETSNLLQRFADSIMTGIVFAVIASLLTTSIIGKMESQSKIDEQLNNISNIYIGCNKQWADEKFGAPHFSGKQNEYTLCAYVTDFFVVQIAFDDAQSAKAYLITALDNNKNIHIKINDKTINAENSYILGEFSYYDFPGRPEYVGGGVSNGNARAVYYEKYYFNGGGNYYNYYIGFLDYGKAKSALEENVSQFDMTSGDIDDEVSADQNHGIQIITDRHNCYPNTYGVSTGNVDVTYLLFSYSWFNSQQLRNSLN